jgi:hypothetical protein
MLIGGVEEHGEEENVKSQEVENLRKLEKMGC